MLAGGRSESSVAIPVAKVDTGELGGKLAPLKTGTEGEEPVAIWSAVPADHVWLRGPDYDFSHYPLGVQIQGPI